MDFFDYSHFLIKIVSKYCQLSKLNEFLLIEKTFLNKKIPFVKKNLYIRPQEKFLENYILSKLLDNYQLSYNAFGAPIIPNFFISISHSQQFVAICFSKIHKCGLDIELTTRNFYKLKDKFIGFEQASTHRHLALSWSAKEAIFKLWQKGNLSFKENIHLYLPKELSNYGQFKGEIKLSNKEFLPVKVFYYFFASHVLTLAVYEQQSDAITNI